MQLSKKTDMYVQNTTSKNQEWPSDSAKALWRAFRYETTANLKTDESSWFSCLLGNQVSHIQSLWDQTAPPPAAEQHRRNTARMTRVVKMTAKIQGRWTVIDWFMPVVYEVNQPKTGTLNHGRWHTKIILTLQVTQQCFIGCRYLELQTKLNVTFYPSILTSTKPCTCFKYQPLSEWTCCDGVVGITPMLRRYRIWIQLTKFS